ncbi:MAG: nicotinate phosphoribosyltransferase [Burkholderiales bacterium]|nr:nicotinate phosphoribosyltransferase [Anaerolineae bacterium]
MSIFNGRRLSSADLKLDVDGLRRGYYTDKYFNNVVHVLDGLRRVGYTFAGNSPRQLPVDPSNLNVGDIVVEAQIFNRHAPRALVAGVDMALAMLRHATGYFDSDGSFVETWQELEVEAVHDGVFTTYAGDPEHIRPVIRVRGRYRDFALLETSLLGALTRISRVASNVYDVMEVSNGKRILFFPARFDLPEVQAADGYAYWLAHQRYNQETGISTAPLVSTDAQGAWWGGRGGGTIPHAIVACFLADTAEAMIAYAQHMPLDVSRIALVDFNDDAVGASLSTMNVFWPRYRAAFEAGDVDEQRRWTLNGVRLDTSKNVVDVSLGPDGPAGVNPTLVYVVRDALDNAWQKWNVPNLLLATAKEYCRSVKIVVSGGFNRARIQQFEAANVPVDSYGVGSNLLRNDDATNIDYTLDIVRILMDGQWVDMAKTGRLPNDNPDLQMVDLSAF